MDTGYPPPDAHKGTRTPQLSTWTVDRAAKRVIARAESVRFERREPICEPLTVHWIILDVRPTNVGAAVRGRTPLAVALLWRGSSSPGP